MESSDAIIVDIDGTLAHMDGNRGPFEWEKVGNDRVDIIVREMVKNLAKSFGLTVILVSGRDVICRPETERWLTENQIKYNYLHMRPHDDHRADTIIKREIYDNHIDRCYNVVAVIDDRPKVIKMWREDLGLRVIDVGKGIDF